MTDLLKRTNDLIFKAIFGSVSNKDILADFLLATLKLPEEEFSHLEISNPFTTVDKIDDKVGILDIKVFTKNKYVINVEMQVKGSVEFRDRVIYYISKSVSEQMNRGGEYKLKGVVSILITDFEMIVENDEYHNVFELYDINTGAKFSDLIQINTLEIPKLKEFEDSDVADWLRFIKSESLDELDYLSNKNEKISKARDSLTLISMDEHMRAAYDSREKARWDEMSRLKGAKDEGKVEGRIEEKINTIRNSLNANLDIQVIAKIAELTVGDVEKIIRDHDL